MTASVTSIAKVRAAARSRAERLKTNNRTATTLLVLGVVLIVIGLGATQSASSVVAIEQAEDRFYFFKRQLVGVGIGTIALLVTSRIPYRFYRRLALPGFAVTVALLAAVLFLPRLGVRDLWPPDEARFAVIAEDMVRGGSWVAPDHLGRIYAEKPPLQLWAVAAASLPAGRRSTRSSPRRATRASPCRLPTVAGSRIRPIIPAARSSTSARSAAATCSCRCRSTARRSRCGRVTAGSSSTAGPRQRARSSSP